MKLVCPACKSEIPIEDVDFGNESAFCYHCQQDFDCGTWISEAYVVPENLQHPPGGAGFEATADGFKVSVSTRSFRWLFFLPAALFWSFLLLFFSYGFLHAPPGTRWLLFLFLTPFYLAGLFLWGITLMALGGRIVVKVTGDTGTILKGVGPIGWKRHFNASQVRKIRISTIYSAKTGNQQQIAMEGEKVITLARGVRPDRLRFMLIALHQMRRANQSGQASP